MLMVCNDMKRTSKSWTQLGNGNEISGDGDHDIASDIRACGIAERERERNLLDRDRESPSIDRRR